MFLIDANISSAASVAAQIEEAVGTDTRERDPERCRGPPTRTTFPVSSQNTVPTEKDIEAAEAELEGAGI